MAIRSDVAPGIIVAVVDESVARLPEMAVAVRSGVAPGIIVTVVGDIEIVGAQAEIIRKTAKAINL